MTVSSRSDLIIVYWVQGSRHKGRVTGKIISAVIRTDNAHKRSGELKFYQTILFIHHQLLYNYLSDHHLTGQDLARSTSVCN